MTGERPALVVLSRERDSLPIVHESMGMKAGLEEVENISPPTGSDPRTVSTEGVRIITVNHN